MKVGKGVVRPRRFELLTYSFGGCRSIQLSYGRADISVACQGGIRSPCLTAANEQLSIESTESVGFALRRHNKGDRT
jgi:hypothetical protein